MTFGTTRARSVLAFAVLVATALPALAADVQVRVKNGDLVFTGGDGAFFDVEITPTADGLMVDVGAATLNGGREAQEFPRVTGDWRFDFRHAAACGVNVRSPAEGIARPSPRRVGYVGPREDGHLSLEGVDVRRSMRVDFSLTSAGCDLSLQDCTVGRGVRFFGAARDPGLHLIETTIGGTTNVRIRPRRESSSGSRQTRIQNCDLGRLKLAYELISSEHSEIVVQQSVIRRSARIRAALNMIVRDVSVDGNLVMKSNIHEQDHELQDVEVDGKTTIVTGKDSDTVFLTDCTFGKLRVRTGAQQDSVVTRRVSAGSGSRLEDSEGPRDHWWDDAGHRWIRARGFDDWRDLEVE